MKIKKILFSIVSILLISVMLFSCNTQVNTDDELDEESEKANSNWQPRVYAKDFIAFDADGDGVDEHIAEHDLVAMSGGHGGYMLSIYKTNGESLSYERIFDSDEYLDAHEAMDIQIIDVGDSKFTFYHPATQYRGEYTYSKDSSPYSHLFNEDGTAKKEKYTLVTDTFKRIEPIDFDGDGGEEIEMRQFSWIEWHTNYIGDCVTVWKSVDGVMTLIDLKFEFFYKNAEAEN